MSSQNEPSDVIGTAKIVSYVHEGAPNTEPPKVDIPRADASSSTAEPGLSAKSIKSLNDAVGSMKISSSSKADLLVAGTTMFKMMAGAFDEDSIIANSWSNCRAETFSMRVGPNYNWNKQKGPSPTALYEMAGVDFVKCSKRIDNFGSLVKIPDEWCAIDTHHPMIPPVFIVNSQLPSDFGSSFFTEVTDGDGWSLVIYFKITQATADLLLNLARAPPAVKLFADYCIQAPEAFRAVKSPTSSTNPWIGKFKLTVRCENIDRFGLPSFITSYNSKPVLIRNTGIVIRGPNYIEMDINIHRFASVPKKALSVMFSKFHEMIISMGFCIESREDSEMPETLFGCLTLNKPTHQDAFNWDAAQIKSKRMSTGSIKSAKN